MEYMGETRKSYVQETWIRHNIPGKYLTPSDAQESWTVFVVAKNGSRGSRHVSFNFTSVDEAQAFQLSHPAGTSIDLSQVAFFRGEGLIDRVRDLMDSGFLGRIGAGDEESPLAFDVLIEAGFKRDGAAAEAALHFLGESRVSELRKMHGENWRIAAIFEYCWMELPDSSPAYLAAAYQYNWYILQDNFSAGYLWRELEIAVSGVELEASKLIEMRKKAGDRGREASAKARSDRILSLLENMEAVALRNPDVVRLGPKSIAAIALEKAEFKDTQLWSQGAGQVDEYLGEMRRGEAGEGIKARYLRLFERKTP